METHIQPTYYIEKDSVYYMSFFSIYKINIQYELYLSDFYTIILRTNMGSMHDLYILNPASSSFNILSSVSLILHYRIFFSRSRQTIYVFPSVKVDHFQECSLIFPFTRFLTTIFFHILQNNATAHLALISLPDLRISAISFPVLFRCYIISSLVDDLIFLTHYISYF